MRSRSQLNQFKRELTKLKQADDDAMVRYRLKNGMIAILTGRESEAYQSWVFANSDPKYRSSNGSKLHALTQAVNNTLDTPFESWDSFQGRGGDLLIDVAIVEPDSGVGVVM